MQLRWIQVHERVRAHFTTLPDATLTLILVAAGLFYISVGLFSHNLWLKAGAAAYAILP